MAELLVMARSGGPWEKGDVVSVSPDGWAWGRQECLTDFLVIRISGMADADAKKYEESLVVENTEVAVDDPQRMTVVKLRKYYIESTTVDALVEVVKDYEDITPAEFVGEVKEKVA